MMEPNDIGRLANHVKTIAEKYRGTWDDFELGELEIKMEPWEQELKTLVDNDVHLMNYEEVDDEVLVFLVEYYS